MSALVLRLIIFVVIFGAIYLGVRRIWRDWTSQFRAEEKAIHDRDVKERDGPGVITLERGVDGTFRPPDNKQPR